MERGGEKNITTSTYRAKEVFNSNYFIAERKSSILIEGEILKAFSRIAVLSASEVASLYFSLSFLSFSLLFLLLLSSALSKISLLLRYLTERKYH